MSEPNADSTCSQPDTDRGRSSLSRRRLLALTGGGIAVGAVGSHVVGAAPDRPHEIVFDGRKSSATATYEVGVSGSIAPAGDAGTVEDDDQIDGSSVTGSVTGNTDAYRFGGNLTHLDASGPVEVSINYADTTQSGPDRLEIVTPADGSVEYTFHVDGGVEKVLDAGDNSAEVENDSITTNDDGTKTVSGLTGNGYGDAYDLQGEVTQFQPASGDYTLFLNGEEITLADLTGQDPSSGDGSDGSDGDESDDSDGGESDPSEHELVIATPTDGSVDYSMTTEGQITKVLDAGDDSAEAQNDTVSQNDDGTWSITGMTGNGYGDTLLFVGEPLAFDGQGEYSLYLDGEEITPEELVGEQQDDGTGTLDEALVRVGFDYDAWMPYRLHVDAEPAPLTASEDEYFAASNYETRQFDDGTWLVEGRTGTADPSGPMYGDGYRIAPGDGNGVLGFEASPPDGQSAAVSINGTDVDPATLPALSLPEEDTGSDGGSAENGPIGGGTGYADAVTRDQADYVVRSQSDLSTALSSAGSGDVVFVEGSVDVDLGSSNYDVPYGATLASDRGVDGAAGARLRTSREPTELFRLHGNSRLTGLRLEGPHPGGDTSGDGSARGVTVLGDGVEIDNCDVSAFSYAGIYVNGGDGHIHHNVIRECNGGGLGYGVSMVSGNPTIEYNYFNYNRHSVATDGSHHGYVCRYNHFGPDLTSHVIDAHAPAGTRYEIHNNVVEGYVDTGGQQRPAVAIRAAPDEAAVVEDNWFWNPDPPLSSPSYTWTDEAIIQPETDDYWHNVSFSANHYGESAGVSFADVIPGYDGWRSR